MASLLAERLLDWYRVMARELPWRATRDPYRIWIAEVMLQQTRVETVIPYYQRWMARFPTLADLASADLEQVLLTWEGLGYYRRAHNLHQAAQTIVEKHAGRLPVEVGELEGPARDRRLYGSRRCRYRLRPTRLGAGWQLTPGYCAPARSRRRYRHPARHKKRCKPGAWSTCRKAGLAPSTRL